MDKDLRNKISENKILTHNERAKVISDLESYEKLQTNIEKAIEEMGRYADGFDYIGKHDLASAVENCIKLLKGNI